MAHVVIMGAGIAGLTCAYEMREEIGPNHRVTVVGDKPVFEFTPSNPWVAVGWRERKSTSLAIGPYLQRKGVDFVPSAVTSVDPPNNRLTLANGDALDYDYLVITTGPKLAFDEVEGLGPESGHTKSVCTLGHAEDCYKDVKALFDAPGPVVIGATQMASCFGPAYEYAFILDTELKRRRIRDRVPMTLVTSEPYIGHLGLGGVGDSKGMLESELRERHISWICNARLTQVEAGRMFVEELDAKGGLYMEHELEFKHSMMLPAFKGVDALAGVEGLVNPRGFTLIDQYQRNPTFTNIYSAGVCVAIPPVEKTPVPTGTPKTGYMIETMVTAICHNVAHALRGEEPEKSGTWSALCLADMGNTGAAFLAVPQIPPRNVTWFKKGKWVHLAKVAYERYFLRKMRKGSTEPVYEKYITKLIGLTRLRS